MSEVRISAAEAKQDKLFYVVATIAIVNPRDKTCLLLKRGDNEKVFPGKWSLPGGKLEHGDITELLAKNGNDPSYGVDNILGLVAQRETKEECGLEVDPSTARILKDKVFIRPDGVPVFLCVLATDYIGGEVNIEDDSMTDSAWVSLSDLTSYDCIDGVSEEVALALQEL